MKIYYAGILLFLSEKEKKKDFFKKTKNHLESYFYLKDKPNFLKEMRNENKQK